MSTSPKLHRALTLAHDVERKNESERHWMMKAATVHKIHTSPDFGTGEIDTEKKTSDLIGDIRCHLEETAEDVPDRFVVEIETEASSKDRLKATIQHLRFGYSVFWVFSVEANSARRETEQQLEQYMRSSPSLGVVSLEDGELSMGSPITWEEFEFSTPPFGYNELSIPTYDRYDPLFDHGDFEVGDQRVTIYGSHGSKKLYASRHLGGGQRTLPEAAPWSVDEFASCVRQGDIERIAPVRGSP